MSQFTIHSIQTAPAAALTLLEGSFKKYGFVPNLHGGLAEAPAALEAYMELTALFDKTSLSPIERQVVLLAVSIENQCTYCVAAHSMIARRMVKADPAIVNALRNRAPLPDAKLDALATFARTLVKNRGVVCGKTLDNFIAAGLHPVTSAGSRAGRGVQDAQQLHQPHHRPAAGYGISGRSMGRSRSVRRQALPLNQ